MKPRILEIGYILIGGFVSNFFYLHYYKSDAVPNREDWNK